MKWLFLFFCVPIFGIDLEEHLSPFVLETKQIIIPQFPHPFNASIVRYEGKLLLSFRTIPDMKDKFKSNIYLVYLDEEFNPISTPQLLTLRTPEQTAPCRADEARLLYIDNQLYIVYSDNTDPTITAGGFRMHYAKIVEENGQFIATSTERISSWEGQNPLRREKNWVPFDYRGELHLAYSIEPHNILKPIPITQTCDTEAWTNPPLEWEWGELRGGTPALLENGEYVAFFHSVKRMVTDHSDEKAILHYFMGAYTFSATPPFEITHISPEPIWGKNFYHGANYKTYWFPVRVVFPCGFLSENEFIYISYGRQDHEVWIAKLDKQSLLSSLIPVNNY